MRKILPTWYIEQKLKEIDAEEKYCKEHNINPNDLLEEYEVETEQFVPWGFWLKKVMGWKPFYGTRKEFLAQKGRKRWRFKGSTDWKVINEDGERNND